MSLVSILDFCITGKIKRISIVVQPIVWNIHLCTLMPLWKPVEQSGGCGDSQVTTVEFSGYNMFLVAILYHLESNVVNNNTLVLVISTMSDAMCISKHYKHMRLLDSIVTVVFM